MFRQMQSRPTGSVPPVCFVYRRILPSSSLIGSHGMLTTCSRVLRNIRPRQSRLNCWEASDATTHLPRSSTLVDPKFKPSPTIGLARTIIAGPPRSNSAEWRGLSTAQPEMEEDTGLASVFLEYDVSPVHLIHTMLDAVKLKSTDTYIDFGCGDGRWVIEAAATYGCKSIGIEIVPQLVEKARKDIEKAKLGHLAEIWAVNGFEADLSVADVVSMYYTKEGMEVLVPKLVRELKPGARVIAIKLPIDDWIPDFQKRMYEFKVYTYTMPPKLKSTSL